MKWRYFLVAVLVVGYAMLAIGAPLIAVLGGCALAAILNWRQQKALGVAPPKKTFHRMMATAKTDAL